jgi:subtilisin-like proprotein convertase family protein
MSKTRKSFLIWTASILAVTLASQAGDLKLDFRPLAVVRKDTISVDYHPCMNALLLSQNYFNGGYPNNIDFVLSDGRQLPFSTLSGVGADGIGTVGEVRILSVKPANASANGFQLGDVFAGIKGKIVKITPPRSIVLGAGINVISPLGGPLQQNHTVTVAFALTNAANGTCQAGEIVAELLSSVSVLSPSGAQEYTGLVPGGPAISKNFTFTIGASAESFDAVFALTANTTPAPVSIGTVTFTFKRENGARTFSGGPVVINDRPSSGYGLGTPYPSVVTADGFVSGEVIHKVTLSLLGLTHGYASDIQVLLTSPLGVSMRPLANAGGFYPIQNATLTFEDGYPAYPQNGPGTLDRYGPSAYPPLVTPFPAPAPVQNYNSSFSSFNGVSPDGQWKLFIIDDESGDSGQLQGWELQIQTSVSGNANYTYDATQTTPLFQVDQSWCTLSGGGFVYGLYIDQTGIFHNNLIAVTRNSGVYEIPPTGGTITPLAVISTPGSSGLEGVVTVPNQTRYGDFAGTILTGSQEGSVLYAVRPNGTATPWFSGFPLEDIFIVPSESDFVGCKWFQDRYVVKAPAAQFTESVGDILAVKEGDGGPNESGKLIRIRWQGGTPTVTELESAANQWEHSAFIPADMVKVPWTRLDNTRWEGTTFKFRVNGPSGATLTIQATPSLSSPTWAPIGAPVSLVADATSAEFIDTAAGGFSSRFYRAIIGTYPYHSDNAVGFYRKHVPACGIIFANQLNRGDNDLSVILPSVPDGVTIYRMNSDTGQYHDAISFLEGYGWLTADPDPNIMKFNPGVGAWIFPNSGTQQPFDFVLYGEVPQGQLSTSLRNGSIISPMTPQALGLSVSGFPAEDGDTLYFYDENICNYKDAYGFVAGYGWFYAPVGIDDPVPRVGEGFWFFKGYSASNNRVWSRTFSVW